MLHHLDWPFSLSSDTAILTKKPLANGWNLV